MDHHIIVTTYKSEFFRTSSLFLAAYLVAKRAVFADVSVDDDGVWFQFVWSRACTTWVRQFRSGKTACVDARVFLEALEALTRVGNEALRRHHDGKDY